MCNKYRLNKQEAQYALKYITKKGKQYRREKRAYHCMDCNAWHLTSEEEDPFELVTETIENSKFKNFIHD